MLVDIARLAKRSKCVLQDEPGSLSKEANLVFYLSVYPLFHSQTSDYDVIIDFCVNSVSLATSSSS